MKRMSTTALIVTLGLVFVTSAWAQTPSRVGQDVYWARGLAGETITLDGDLNEPAWNQAEVIVVRYGERSALPTSGWRAEFQEAVNYDPLDATVRMLVDHNNNQLYLAVQTQDSSVGGISSWARWDGLLMSIKDHSERSSIKTTAAREYFYTFWYVNVDSLVAPGVSPRFIGSFGNINDTTRTAAQRRAWDARFKVINGVSNDDATADEGYIMEMRMDLDTLGYNASQSGGEIVELNFSIWDGDWLHSGDPAKITTTRTSWQSPWNGDNDNVGRIYIRPDVTINSGTLPEVAPDLRVPNGATRPAPTIDGILDESSWDYAYTFDITWDDSLLRESYPGVGKWRSGQFQPQVNGNPRPPVLDPGHGTFKMFFRDNFIYFGADITDGVVQGTSILGQWDGVRFLLMARDSVNADNEYEFRRFTTTFDSSTAMIANESLPLFIADGDAEFAYTLKGATTVNDHTDIDEGYVMEMKIDLTALGYPLDLGDHLLFGGVCLFDGDSFDDPLSDYGSRTWWFRENDGGQSTPWMVLDEALTAIGDRNPGQIPSNVELYGNYPNPFNPTTTIRYSVPISGEVKLVVYNVLGQEVYSQSQGKVNAGARSLTFDAHSLSSGIYIYQVQVRNNQTGKIHKSRSARMVLLK